MSGASKKASGTDDAQRRASHPETSVWVSANAGSGKTHALTTRVARLLLAGTDPQRILCLTFTKAAAAEMAGRLYKRLGAWATMPDAELAAEIEGIEGRKPGKDVLDVARKLFARAIETPGGLKIQTIHAFCERLLGRFPLEAGVPPQFEILDERSADELMEEVRDTVLLRAGAEPETPLGLALAHIVSRVDELAFGKLLREITGQRSNFQKMLERFGGLDGICQAVRAALSAVPGVSVDDVLAEIAALPEAAMRGAADTLSRGTKTDGDRAALLHAFLAEPARAEHVDDYIAVFLTKEMAPRKTLITKKLGEANPAAARALEEEQARIEAAERNVRAFLARLEGKIKKLVPRLPSPLAKRLEQHIALVPEDPQNTKVSLGKRLQLIAVIIGEVNKFNSEISIHGEVRKNEQGIEVPVQILYLGLGGAYFVDNKDQYAGIGIPAADGWKWETRTDLAEKISQAIKIYDNTAPAEFVSLPFQVQ